MSPSPSISTPGKSGVVKLRSACNLCHAAKVRCSGEKSGCVRCGGLSQKCIYEESRVGKVQGCRRRQNRAPSESNLSKVSEELSSSNASTSGPSTSTDAESSVASFINDPSVLEWTDSTEDEGNKSMFNNCQEPPSDKPPSFFETREFSPFDIASLEMDLNLDNVQTPCMSSGNGSSLSSSSFNHSSSLMPHQPSISLDNSLYSFQNFTQAPSSLSQRRPRAESQSILTCVKIVEYLELRIHSGVSAIDEVMDVNKASVCEISQLIDVEECKKSSRCLTLISIAMDQVFTLYEAGCTSFQANANPQPNFLAGANPARPSLPSLGLGIFQIDPEEQKAIWAQILIKEISRSKSVLQRLSAGLRLHGTVENHEQLHQGLESRLQALVYSLKR